MLLSFGLAVQTTHAAMMSPIAITVTVSQAAAPAATVGTTPTLSSQDAGQFVFVSNIDKESGGLFNVIKPMTIGVSSPPMFATVISGGSTTIWSTPAAVTFTAGQIPAQSTTFATTATVANPGSDSGTTVISLPRLGIPATTGSAFSTITGDTSPSISSHGSGALISALDSVNHGSFTTRVSGSGLLQSGTFTTGWILVLLGIGASGLVAYRRSHFAIPVGLVRLFALDLGATGLVAFRRSR